MAENKELQKAAEEFINQSPTRIREYGLINSSFTSGANWQKGKDETIIKELIESFNEVLRISDRDHSAWDNAKIAIHNAEQHLK